VARAGYTNNVEYARVVQRMQYAEYDGYSEYTHAVWQCGLISSDFTCWGWERSEEERAGVGWRGQRGQRWAG